MPLYDPNGKKQQPKARTGTSFFSHATCPTNEIVSKRPSHINVNSVGTYAFLYETTSSFGGDVSGQIANFVTGSSVGTNGGGIRLDISPVAWRRTDDTDAVGQIS